MFGQITWNWRYFFTFRALNQVWGCLSHFHFHFPFFVCPSSSMHLQVFGQITWNWQYLFTFLALFQFLFLLCWKSRHYSYLKLVGGGFESTWHTTRDSSPLATPTACPWLKHTGASRIKIFPTWEEKWFVILHWTISETTLLFPEPSLLVAWQEYSPQREISIQNLFHQSHYFVRNL